MPGIDLQTHLAPALDGLADVRRNDTGRLVVDGHAIGPSDLCRPDRLVSHLGAAGLDEAIVSVPRPSTAST